MTLDGGRGAEGERWRKTGRWRGGRGGERRDEGKEVKGGEKGSEQELETGEGDGRRWRDGEEGKGGERSGVHLSNQVSWRLKA